MKILSVEDYNDFSCVGDACPMTCCGGSWMILVDEETANYYRSVEGEFGERLRSALKEGDGKTFLRLDAKGDCMFLDEHKLCEIYKHLGPDRMCYVCKTYPRHLYQVGDILFCYLTNSCPEVTRRILQRSEPLQVILNDSEMEGDGKKADWVQFNHAIRAFTTGMDLLQDRRLFVQERVALLLAFVNQFQEMMTQKKDPSGLIQVFAAPEVYDTLLSDMPIYERDYRSKVKIFAMVFGALFSTSYDHPMWKNCKELAEKITGGGEIDQDRLVDAFERADTEELQLEMEQLMTYRFFVAFMQGFENTDYFERMAYECVLYAALNSYMALTEVEQGRACSQEERILFYSLCSRTDHSKDGKKDLQDRICKEECGTLEYLLKLIS